MTIQFHRTTLSDVQTELPDLIDASPEALAEYDLFICVNGFEDRAAAVSAWLSRQGVSIPMCLMLRYPTNSEDNRRTAEALSESLARISGHIETFDFGVTAPKLRECLMGLMALAPVGGQFRVLLDVSGASGRMILRLLRSLFELSRDSSASITVSIVYAEADQYAPTKAEADQLIAAAKSVDGEATLGLDFDAEELSPSVEYPGQHIDHVPDRAVVICGFNADRARAALDHIDSAFNIDVPHARVTYIAGRPPHEDDQWRLNAMVDINSFGEKIDSLDVHITSTLYYKETLRQLEAQYEASFGRERITVLPFGSKMQTIATALFCEIHPDVKVQLLAPARYAGANYSVGQGNIHLLPLGDLTALAATLRRVGQLVEINS